MSSTEREAAAVTEGWWARLAGKVPACNPHDLFTTEHSDWKRGWLAAQQVLRHVPSVVDHLVPEEDRVRLQRTGPPAFTLIARPTMDGWWLAYDGRCPSLHFFTDRIGDREGLFAFYRGFWRSPEEMDVFRWAGPVELENALTKGDKMNEPEKNAASTHEACSLHEVGRPAKDGDHPKIKIRVWWTCSNYFRHEHRWRWQAYVCGAAQWCLLRAWAWIEKEKKVKCGPTARSAASTGTEGGSNGN